METSILRDGLFTRTRFAVLREGSGGSETEWVIRAVATDSPYADSPGKLLEDFRNGIEEISLRAEYPYYPEGVPGVSWGLYQDINGERLWFFAVRRKGIRKAVKPVPSALADTAIGVLAGQVSHDIYNFMTAVLGATSLLRRRIAEDDHRFSHVLQLNAAISSAKVKFSGLSLWSGREPVMKEDLDWVREVQAQLGHLESRFPRTVFLTCFPETQLVMESPKLPVRFIIGSLLENGCEAAQDEAYVQVSLERENGCIRFIVETPGARISDESLEKAFLPTYSGWQRRSRGLGLTIALAQARRLGGDLTLERTEKGVTSTFVLPLEQVTLSVPQLETQLKDGANPGELMLVDADNTSRGLLRSALEAEGWSVHEASFGAAALVLLRALPQPPRIILCNLTPLSSVEEPWVEQLLSLPGSPMVLFFVPGEADIDVVLEQTGVTRSQILSRPFSPVDLVEFVGSKAGAGGTD